MAEKEKKQSRIGKFFKDLKSELKKITWPSKEDTKKKTMVVIVELVAFGVVIGLLDYAFNELVLLLGSIVS